AGAGVGPAAADLPDVHEVGDERADVVAVRRLAAGGRGRRGRLPGVVPAAARVAEAVPEAVAVAVPVAEAVPVLVAPAEGLGRGLGGGVRVADEGAALVLTLLGPLLLVLAPVALVLPGPLVLVLLVVPLTLVTGVAVPLLWLILWLILGLVLRSVLRLVLLGAGGTLVGDLAVGRESRLSAADDHGGHQPAGHHR